MENGDQKIEKGKKKIEQKREKGKGKREKGKGNKEKGKGKGEQGKGNRKKGRGRGSTNHEIFLVHLFFEILCELLVILQDCQIFNSQFRDLPNQEIIEIKIFDSSINDDIGEFICLKHPKASSVYFINAWSIRKKKKKKKKRRESGEKEKNYLSFWQQYP
jgi:hypothetical protein